MRITALPELAGPLQNRDLRSHSATSVAQVQILKPEKMYVGPTYSPNDIYIDRLLTRHCQWNIEY